MTAFSITVKHLWPVTLGSESPEMSKDLYAVHSGEVESKGNQPAVCVCGEHGEYMHSMSNGKLLWMQDTWLSGRSSSYIHKALFSDGSYNTASKNREEGWKGQA